MKTVDSIRMRAPATDVFRAAVEVENWPEILPHYRWVNRLGSDGDADVVEMAAWRPFGFLKYPTWWRSRMWPDKSTLTVKYHHIGGITRGMDVEWRLEPVGGETAVTITHWWDGPAWPVIKWPAANLVIGPVFVSGIASRTLAGIAKHLESND